MDNILSIKEFAERAGRKTQGLYKQATNKNSRLYPYVVHKDGKLYIREVALEEVYQRNQTNQTTDENDENNSNNRTNSSNSTDETNSTNQFNRPKDEDTIDFFKELLREKDKQIETLTRLLDQEQHLHAQTKLLLNEYKEKEEKGIEEQEEPGQETPKQEEPKKKRSWFVRWLYGEE